MTKAPKILTQIAQNNGHTSTHGCPVRHCHALVSFGFSSIDLTCSANNHTQDIASLQRNNTSIPQNSKFRSPTQYRNSAHTQPTAQLFDQSSSLHGWMRKDKQYHINMNEWVCDKPCLSLRTGETRLCDRWSGEMICCPERLPVPPYSRTNTLRRINTETRVFWLIEI